MKKPFFMIIGTTTILVATALPSYASYSSLLSSFIGIWQTQIQGIQDRLEQQLAGMNLDFGKLGLPDIEQAEQKIEEAYQKTGDHVLADEASNEVIRKTTEEYAQGTLSDSGQEAVKKKLESIDQSVKTLESQANTAQDATVTQEVLKQIALQNAQQGLLMGGLQTEITDLSVKQDLANRNLVNISEGIDASNRREQTELEGAANSVLYTSSLFNGFFGTQE